MSMHEKPPPTKICAPNEILLYGVNVGRFVDVLNKDRINTHKELNGNIDPINQFGGRYLLDLSWRRKGKMEDTGGKWRMAVVYGYAFEGHCYDFDKPKTLVFRIRSGGYCVGADEYAKGCGYSGNFQVSCQVCCCKKSDDDDDDNDKKKKGKKAKDKNDDGEQKSEKCDECEKCEKCGKCKTCKKCLEYHSDFKMWRLSILQEVREISIESGFAENVILQANLPGRRSPNTYAANMQLAHRGGRLTS